MRHLFLALVAIIAISCDKQESIEPIYDFALSTEPQSHIITAGETIEIACELHKSYFYSPSDEFTLSYEQSQGIGTLRMEGNRLSEGSSYTLPNGEFTLTYTAQGEENHQLQLVITDQFGNHEYQSIQFTHYE